MAESKTVTLVGTIDNLPEGLDTAAPNSLRASFFNINSDGSVLVTFKTSDGYTLNFSGKMLGPNGAAIAPATGETWSVDPGSVVLSNINTDPIITIKSVEYTPPEANLEITSDAELLEESIKAYGAPVRTINGVLPDESGNITIQPDNVNVVGKCDDDRHHDDESQNEERFYACIAGINTAAGAIKIALSQQIQCEDTAIIDTVMTNIAQLNERASEIAELITRLDAAQSGLATRIEEMVR
jgi:hypothetical protein